MAMSDEERKGVYDASASKLQEEYAALPGIVTAVTELDNALDDFARACQAVNVGLKKNVKVPYESKGERKEKTESHSFVRQVKTAHRQYINATDPETRVTKLAEVNKLLTNALRFKGAAPTEADAPDLAGFVACNGIENYAAAVKNGGKTQDELEVLKRAVNPAAPAALTAEQQARNRAYLEQINQTRELQKAIAASAALQQDRHMMMAARRSMAWLPEGIKQDLERELTLSTKEQKAEVVAFGQTTLNALADPTFGLRWDSDTGGLTFTGAMGAKGGTTAVVALVNNQHRGQNSQINWNGGSVMARRAAARTAFALGVKFQFKDDQANQSIKGTPASSVALSNVFRMMCKELGKNSAGVYDLADVYAGVYRDTNFAGPSGDIQTWPQWAMGKNTARLNNRAEFWKALVHETAGETGIPLSQAIRGLHALSVKDSKTEEEKLKKLDEFQYALRDAASTIGTTKVLKLLLINKNLKTFPPAAMRAIAKTFLTGEGKYTPNGLNAQFRVYHSHKERQAVYSKLARELTVNDARIIATELFEATEAGSDEEKAKAQTQTQLGNYIQALDGARDKSLAGENIEAKDKSQVGRVRLPPEPGKAKLLEVLRAQRGEKELKDVTQKVSEDYLASLSQKEVKALCTFDASKVGGTDGHLEFKRYSDAQLTVLQGAHNDRKGNPVAALTGAELAALSKEDFKKRCDGMPLDALVDPTTIDEFDPIANLDNISQADRVFLEKKRHPQLHDQVDPPLHDITVSELKTLCEQNKVNAKTAALDTLVEKAFIAKSLGPPAVQVRDLTAKQRAEAIAPLITAIAKGGIAGNVLTNRATSYSAYNLITFVPKNVVILTGMLVYMTAGLFAATLVAGAEYAWRRDSNVLNKREVQYDEVLHKMESYLGASKDTSIRDNIVTDINAVIDAGARAVEASNPADVDAFRNAVKGVSQNDGVVRNALRDAGIGRSEVAQGKLQRVAAFFSPSEASVEQIQSRVNNP